ncbi:hypothetical protein M9H77_27891 [Catharanthus roseus]|uniref:Uncharacterized protein n=1 Tax=Catharanthus roseus TaxID=4058 RepID=A0ACC0ADT7_CATRO|nr:hypothetical protein M9H77_27891 [Catharanthus roseus]
MHTQVEQDVDYSSFEFFRDTIARSNSFLKTLVKDSVNNFKSSLNVALFRWMCNFQFWTHMSRKELIKWLTHLRVDPASYFEQKALNQEKKATIYWTERICHQKP